MIKYYYFQQLKKCVKLYYQIINSDTTGQVQGRAVCKKVIFPDFFNLQEWFDDISVDGEVSAWVDLVFVGCSRNPWAFAHKSMEWKKGAKQTDQAKEKGENPIDRRNLK